MAKYDMEVTEHLNVQSRVDESVTYNRKRIEEITGIPARRIQFYTESGLVSMSEGNLGKGRTRLYSKKNIVELLVVRAMSRTRIELRMIKDVMFLLKSPVPMVKCEHGWRIATKDETVDRNINPVPEWQDVDFPLYIVVAFKPNADMLVQYALDIADMVCRYESIYVVDFKLIVDAVKAM
jgi:DNA-binding transcriptional MerR regulator